MRRLIALILMLIVPLQFAWSAAVSLHGHVDGSVMIQVMHAHDHGDHDAGHDDHDASLAGDTGSGHNDDGHHGNHYHPVFSSILMEIGLSLDALPSDRPSPHPLASFHSHTPPLFDRPPLALA